MPRVWNPHAADPEPDEGPCARLCSGRSGNANAGVQRRIPPVPSIRARPHHSEAARGCTGQAACSRGGDQRQQRWECYAGEQGGQTTSTRLPALCPMTFSENGLQVPPGPPADEPLDLVRRGDPPRHILKVAVVGDVEGDVDDIRIGVDHVADPVRQIEN